MPVLSGPLLPRTAASVPALLGRCLHGRPAYVKPHDHPSSGAGHSPLPVRLPPTVPCALVTPEWSGLRVRHPSLVLLCHLLAVPPWTTRVSFKPVVPNQFLAMPHLSISRILMHRLRHSLIIQKVSSYSRGGSLKGHELGLKKLPKDMTPTKGKKVREQKGS